MGTVHESIEIAAPPAVVWAQLVDPHGMAAWHAKLVEVRRDGRGPVRFGTTYIQSRKKQNRKDSGVRRGEGILEPLKRVCEGQPEGESSQIDC